MMLLRDDDLLLFQSILPMYGHISKSNFPILCGSGLMFLCLN